MHATDNFSRVPAEIPSSPAMLGLSSFGIHYHNILMTNLKMLDLQTYSPENFRMSP